MLALTPGLTGLCSAFEALSERIIRELTSKASWATISRAASPEPLLDFNQSMIEPSGYMPAFSREAQTQGMCCLFELTVQLSHLNKSTLVIS